jgi:hypothetical protein
MFVYVSTFMHIEAFVLYVYIYIYMYAHVCTKYTCTTGMMYYVEALGFVCVACVALSLKPL